jgi:hypothetical protein
MSMVERPSRQQDSRARRRSSAVRAVLIGIALVFAFLLGLAFAKTLDDRPEDGRAVTSVRTLTPLPQRGEVRTVTVTVTSP